MAEKKAAKKKVRIIRKGPEFSRLEKQVVCGDMAKLLQDTIREAKKTPEGIERGKKTLPAHIARFKKNCAAFPAYKNLFDEDKPLGGTRRKRRRK